MTVAELRRRMSTAEKVRWLAYDRYREALRNRIREKERMEAEVSKARKRRRAN